MNGLRNRDLQDLTVTRFFSTLHIHLDYDNCLEVIVAAGKLAE